MKILMALALLVFAACGSNGTGGTGTGGGTTVGGPYVVSADQLTVTDTSTGLVWQCDVVEGAHPGCSFGNKCTSSEANNYCLGLTLDGSGWRLPTLKELSSIEDRTVPSPGPTINQTAFPNTPPFCFSTSSPMAGSSYSWVVNFGYGPATYGDSTTNYVRCVR
jgi:hypothetical protein